MEEILLFLLKKGAKDSAVKISTKDLGKVLGISQQTASKKLIDLILKSCISLFLLEIYYLIINSIAKNMTNFIKITISNIIEIVLILFNLLLPLLSLFIIIYYL